MKQERDILKKATMFFAKESKGGTLLLKNIAALGRSNSWLKCWLYRSAAFTVG